MRKLFRKQIKDYLRVSFLQTRGSLHLTQEQMAARLLVSTRAYAKLESGRTCCSLLTSGPFWKAYWTFWIPLTSPKADFVSFSLTFPTLQPFLFPCSSISYTLFYHPLFPLYPLTFNS